MSIEVGDRVQYMVHRGEGEDGPKYGERGVVTHISPGVASPKLYVKWNVWPSFWSTNPQYVLKLEFHQYKVGDRVRACTTGWRERSEYGPKCGALGTVVEVLERISTDVLSVDWDEEVARPGGWFTKYWTTNPEYVEPAPQERKSYSLLEIREMQEGKKDSGLTEHQKAVIRCADLSNTTMFLEPGLGKC